MSYYEKMQNSQPLVISDKKVPQILEHKNSISHSDGNFFTKKRKLEGLVEAILGVWTLDLVPKIAPENRNDELDVPGHSIC